MGGLNTLSIDNGVLLDGLAIKGVRSYSVSQAENADIAELTLTMDVSILTDSQAYNSLNQGLNSLGKLHFCG